MDGSNTVGTILDPRTGIEYLAKGMSKEWMNEWMSQLSLPVLSPSLHVLQKPEKTVILVNWKFYDCSTGIHHWVVSRLLFLVDWLIIPVKITNTMKATEEIKTDHFIIVVMMAIAVLYSTNSNVTHQLWLQVFCEIHL